MVLISVGDPDPVPYDRMFSGLPSPHPDPFVRGQNVTHPQHWFSFVSVTIFTFFQRCWKLMCLQNLKRYLQYSKMPAITTYTDSIR
jgi:hypothetical protein